MAYTDLTNTFEFNRKLTYQDFSKLGANDAFLKTNYAYYRKPNIKVTVDFTSARAIEVEPNFNDSSTTIILFPDGELRSVSESRFYSILSPPRYIAAYANISASLTSSPPIGGSGITLGVGGPVSNQWIAVYAVKATSDATKFVIVLSSLAPFRANLSTLNSSFGTNGWVYLGTCRYGANQVTTTTFLGFKKVGPWNVFTEQYASSGSNASLRTVGFVIANGTGVSSLTYTYSAGMTNLLIPNHFSHLLFGAAFNAIASATFQITDSGTNRKYDAGDAATNTFVQHYLFPASEGFRINTPGKSGTKDIVICGWIDPLMSVGMNTLI